MANIQDFKNKINNQKGATAILLAVLVLGTLIIVGMTISTILLRQIGAVAEAGQSVKAFYAADSGAELCLYQARKDLSPCNSPGGTIPKTYLTFGASYTAKRVDGTTIEATGFLGKTSRRVELTW